jgi:glycosyltransferase involved in cell wall biosynthesis
MEKILILANNDIGLYKFRKELIEELLKDTEVSLSLPYGDFVEPLIELGCNFINTNIDRRGINPLKDLNLIFNYFKILKNEKPDLVITYTIKPNIYGGLACRVMKIDYVTNITGLGTSFQTEGILRKFIIFLYKISCKKANVVFFENEDNQNTFIKHRIVSVEKTFKLNGAGVNIEEYEYSDYPEENDQIRFLFIGRIMKEKGIDEILEVATRIKKENDNIVFDIVGPEEGNYHNLLKRMDECGIINYYGYQKDVKPYIKQSHCFILPSYHEGMSNTLLESGAMGRPIITSDIPGCRETVNNSSGYLVKVKDSNDLYNKINSFISTPYDEKLRMSVNSRKHIESVFDKKIVVRETLREIMNHGKTY